MPTIKSILNNKNKYPICLPSRAKVIEASKLMSKNKIGSVLIEESGKIVGIFTERDLMNKVVTKHQDPNQTKISDVMTTRVAVCNQEMQINEVAQLMSQNRIRHIPVLENGNLVGVISSGDILAWKLKDQEMIVRHMEDYFLCDGKC